MSTEVREFATLRDLHKAERAITTAIHDLKQHVDSCYSTVEQRAELALSAANVADSKATSSHSRIDTWQRWAIVTLTGLVISLVGASVAFWKMLTEIQHILKLVE